MSTCKRYLLPSCAVGEVTPVVYASHDPDPGSPLQPVHQTRRNGCRIRTGLWWATASSDHITVNTSSLQVSFGYCTFQMSPKVPSNRFVQHTLFSYPGFLPPVRDPALPAPVQEPAYRCENQHCPKFGRSFVRKTEFTNHCQSKDHRREAPPTKSSGPQIKDEELEQGVADDEGDGGVSRPTKKPRHQYRVGVKKRVVDAVAAEVVEQGALTGVVTTVAKRFRICKQRVSDWWHQRDSITQLLRATPRTAEGSERHGKITERGRLSRLPFSRSGNYPACEATTYEKFQKARNAATRITRLWFSTTMRMAVAAAAGMDAAEAFRGSRGWLQNFCRRFNVVWRRRTNSKNKTADERFPAIQQWLARLRRRLARGAETAEWGRWPLDTRWNVDQVPISVDSGGTHTYSSEGARTVAVRGRKNANRDAARFCTCQLLVRLDGHAAFMTVLFRGTGARISLAERRAYHPGVRVHFQKKAYYDNIECHRWVCEDLPAHIAGQPSPRLLFLDNLAGHATDEFNEGLREVGVKRHFFVGGCTDICQPIDAGVGVFVQHGFQRARDAWLAVEENSAKWFSGVGASELRVLTTHWLAAALGDLRAKPYLVAAAAARTGCAMRPDAPGDGVKLQGLEGKHVDYDDVGSNFGDRSDSDDEPGVIGALSDSGAESYGRGGDSEHNESLVSDSEEDSDEEVDACGWFF
eukprot:GHVU01098415.1.p1 GENE.GHVU01098415.1~~GHVU01098415.1.p1  ORF type:complete len:694 (+),score=72.64 GHVU01098415.1:84-2165(+)